jgi:hypothetical protein
MAKKKTKNASIIKSDYIPSVKVGRPAFYETVEELEDAIDRYFQSCFIPYLDKSGEQVKDKEGNQVYIQNQPFTVIGLSLALGFKSRQSLFDYIERGDKFTDTIIRAKQICENYANQRLFDRDGVNGAKFTLINNFKNYSDKKELDLNDNTAIQAILDSLPEETRKQVAESVKERLKKGVK